MQAWQGRFLETSKLPWRVELGERHVWQFRTGMELDWEGIPVYVQDLIAQNLIAQESKNYFFPCTPILGLLAQMQTTRPLVITFNVKYLCQLKTEFEKKI